jgi:acetylornithine deacetylase/succinyl-diaminopimelate desuccinylase-like protein
MESSCSKLETARASGPDCDLFKLLTQLVEIPSVLPDEQKLSEFISAYLEGKGFKISTVTSAPNRQNIVATPPGNHARYLAFYGHMDTVPPASDYTGDPFAVTLQGKIASGLGVADMKGGLTAILSLADSIVERSLPVKLIFGVDEEGISLGSNSLIASGLLSDIELMIVAESGQVRDLNQRASLVYGRKGRTLFRLSVRGKKAHAAESDRAINAVSEAAKLLGLVDRISIPNDDVFGVAETIVHSIQAGTDSFSIPELCQIELSLLSTPEFSQDHFTTSLAAAIDEAGLECTIEKVKRETPYAAPYRVDRSHPLVARFEQEVFSSNGLTPTYASSVADENFFSAGLDIPVITLGPIGGGDHTAQEWLSLPSLHAVKRIYEQLVDSYYSHST